MKKILCFILTLSLIFILAMPCFAEEIIPEADAGTETEITFGERLIEFWNEYTAEILSSGGILATLGLVFTLWRKLKPLLTKILKTGADSSYVQDKHSKALNGLLDGVEELDKKITDFENNLSLVKQTQNETAEHFKEIQRSLSNLARLLDAAYSNSKALPQGTKEMIHLSCAECIRIADHEIYGETEGASNVE